MLLYSSASNLLSFEGYTTESICEAVREQKQKSLWDTGEICMVKLRFDKSKRRYKNNKKIYSYDRITLVFPREYYDLLKPFQDKQLSMLLMRKNGCLTISLSESPKS